MTRAPDIVIVGAGAAGIGAARRLAGSGLSLLMIEALPRLGGRSWTRQAAGVPLDLGCEWLHSGDRNPWTRLAGETGFTVDRRPPAWGGQYGDLGFSAAEQEEADHALADWNARLAALRPASDCAADALVPGGRWNAYLQAMSGYVSGDRLERISATDYTAYDDASTGTNWRVREGYGTLIAGSLPTGTELRLATPVEAITLEGSGVKLTTPAGTIRSRLAILTVSTNVLAGEAIRLPPALDPWREAAAGLPLGRDEKLFLEIVGDGPFAPESHVIGDPHDATTGAYYIRPFGWPVIEGFFGGEGAEAVAAAGADAAFERAIGEIVRLFGADARRHLRPLIASDWSGTPSIGGAYSHALPGQVAARGRLARPFEDRLLFAGEATHATDFSTAHGAYESGLRAAEQALALLGRKSRS
ncbi:flavin monoamine oxidase family protein [Ancylobacter oerskovii]|uniref:Tryptophan 2-monooxygenase n=1 Tax=Ancylobacter oerskovii TaxID=459519 RepID=A0ABW4YYG1_9HYPH|nr:FAD-dependent oxidoreductase [Ancylobacter oerskovii]MBS7541815.1 FAD-dependent oxidoreductase [Ancylobacter oerskovii]